MAVHNIIRKAIKENKRLRIHYNDGSKKTKRTFEPKFLFQWGNHYYVSGFCHLRKASRVFKLSRVQECEWINKDASESVGDILDALNSDHFSFLEIVIDTYPLDLKQELERLQIRLKENIVREYPKEVLLPKMEKAGRLRSPLEERVIHKIIEDPEVILIEIEPFTIPYQFEGKERNYVPDVLVHYQNGKKVLIEIKVSGDIDEPKNQAKFQAAQVFCDDHDMELSILGIEGGRTNSRYYSAWGDDDDEFFIEEFPVNYGGENLPQPIEEPKKPKAAPPRSNKPRIKKEPVKPDLKAIYIKKYINPEGVAAFMNEEQNTMQQDTADATTLKKLLKTELKMVRTRIEELQEIIYEFEKTEEKIVRSLEHLESKEKGEKEGFKPITSLQLKGKRGKFSYDPVLLNKGLWKVSADIKETGYSLGIRFITKKNDWVISEYFEHTGSEALVRIDKPTKCYPTIDASEHASWGVELKLIE